MNASAWTRASSVGARSGCMRLAASRNARLSDAGGTGSGAGATARAAEVVRRARECASRAPARSPVRVEDARLDVVELGEDRDHLARVVGLEDGELGLEHRVLGLELGEPVAQAGQVGLAGRDELSSSASSCATGAS